MQICELQEGKLYVWAESFSKRVYAETPEEFHYGNGNGQRPSYIVVGNLQPGDVFLYLKQLTVASTSAIYVLTETSLGCFLVRAGGSISDNEWEFKTLENFLLLQTEGEEIDL